jgi:hypothetical protein
MNSAAADHPLVPACRQCGPGAGFRCGWRQDSLGRRHVRASCARRGAWLVFLPSRGRYARLADAAASQTAILDALTRLEALGVEPYSDGTRVYFAPGDHQRVPPDLHAVIRQCGHALAKMLAGGRRVPHEHRT